jgi:hypothetical protein
MAAVGLLNRVMRRKRMTGRSMPRRSTEAGMRKWVREMQ